MNELDVSEYFKGHGLTQGKHETRHEFSKRVYEATRAGERWHPSYKPVVDHCFGLRALYRTSHVHEHYMGFDERLQFNPASLPKDFDTENGLFIVDSSSGNTTLTAQYNHESFFYSVSNGHYAAMLDKVMQAKVVGGLETMIQCMVNALAKIPKT
jgi:hypothetical protein